MCDAPSIAAFRSESIQCFPAKASKFFFTYLVSFPVAPIITGIIVNFGFHIRCNFINFIIFFIIDFRFFYDSMANEVN